MGTRLLFGAVGALCALITALVLNALFAALLPPQQNTPNLLFQHDPEIVRRLRAAGAQFGDPQFSLMWNNFNDLDLHVIDPTGAHISYRNRQSPSGGELDVDANADFMTDRPVENIYWRPGHAPQGDYQVYVHHYANKGAPDPTPYTLRIVMNGRVREYTGALNPREESRPIRVNPAAVEDWEPLAGDGWGWQVFLIVGGWGAALGAMLALGLRLPQRWFGVSPEAFGWKQVLGGMLVGLGGGALAGLLAQGMFSLLFAWNPLMARALGFAVLGGVLGYGLARGTPNLPPRAATLAGILGGLLASGAFFWALANATDATGRWLGAGIIGLAIGLMITFVQVVMRYAVVRSGGSVRSYRLNQRYRLDAPRR
ncbi:MAG: hypothetical protein N2045_04620 [Fimbriimonadales bacterium]|jgi:hypothetical protein|nr:hypothetical protein [Fimbriimonadales bacterium]GIV14278.1 MAG: hypothetical protein KatS3mg021_2560 [Fimbriimonadales bacterium]CUU02956.1 Uncharacterized protein conserved in bacteria (DUF2135) [Armatimonadetes bacterium GBS]CUU37146.1 Uncharacterized protein conserved in bacteria (DUF2135) [Armatimonadetes bacterium GXS]